MADEEPVLYLERNMNEPDLRSLGAGEAAVFSARAPGKETPNEDAAALIPCAGDGWVLLVADGMGGSRAGKEAAAIAVHAMARALAEGAAVGAPLRHAIVDGFERANGEVQALGVGAATTLAAVEVADGSVRPYHVGDSTILLFGGRGKLKLQTVAHSPVGFAVEAGLLDETEAMHHEDRHLVSNAIGAPDMRIEIGSARRLSPRDTLLLASDGLSDNLHTGEILDCALGAGLGEAAGRLATRARRRMDEPRSGEPSKPDDLTFVAFRPARRTP